MKQERVVVLAAVTQDYCLLGCNAVWLDRWLANVSEEPDVSIFRTEAAGSS
jgi:hypothetical protein